MRQRLPPRGSWQSRQTLTEGVSSREKGVLKSPQAFQNPKISNNSSADYGQSAAEAIPNPLLSPTATAAAMEAAAAHAPEGAAAAKAATAKAAASGTAAKAAAAHAAKTAAARRRFWRHGRRQLWRRCRTRRLWRWQLWRRRLLRGHGRRQLPWRRRWPWAIIEDLEWPPLHSGHNQRKNYLKFWGSEKPAGFSEPLFHGKKLPQSKSDGFASSLWEGASGAPGHLLIVPNTLAMDFTAWLPLRGKTSPAPGEDVTVGDKRGNLARERLRGFAPCLPLFYAVYRE